MLCGRCDKKVGKGRGKAGLSLFRLVSGFPTVGSAPLNLPRRQIELFGELSAFQRVRFLVGDKDILQYSELRRAGALAGLDGVENVRKERSCQWQWAHAVVIRVLNCAAKLLR